MKNILLISVIAVLLVACGSNNDKKAEAGNEAAKTDSTLTIPSGFKATIAVDESGRNRHIVVNSNGDIYVKLEKLRDGKGILVLRDTNNNGTYEVVKSFGDYTGTGIAIRNGYLYASSDNDVYRYKMENNEVVDSDSPEKIVTGLIGGEQHGTKSIALDTSGNIYVNIGAPSNACQVEDRSKGSPGQDPCPILEKAGGIWQFKVDKLNQSYAEGVRYATGLRNVVGLDWSLVTNQLYVMQHGRDQLSEFYPDLYNKEQSSELPAEEFFALKQGSDCGWPYCYYDHLQKKKLLNPEYGGDKKKQDRCAGKEQPIMAFPGHWGPNAVLFYTGTMFPEKYRNGAFIAFHGSWNRSGRQAGYNVVFVPFKDGKPTGDYEVFADGFMGKESIEGSDQAKFRPCGLAQGPDGALYISDSKKGRIWRVSYQ